MGSHFWLSGEAWSAVEPHLPKNQPGARRVDDRRVISGILHVLTSSRPTTSKASYSQSRSHSGSERIWTLANRGRRSKETPQFSL